MTEERLQDMESKLAHHELAIEQLSDVASAQQKEIKKLERKLRELEQRLQAVLEDGGSAGTEPEIPPHY